MKDKIFINYRRTDSSAHAGRLCDSLTTYFGADRMFIDIDRIKGGENFVKAIEGVLDSTAAMLVVIGTDWLTVSGEKGRRLDDPQDYVRLEIMTALEKGLPIIPVLVAGARMPSEAALPPELRSLAHMNAVLASDERWGSDTRRLAAILELDVKGSLTERRFNNRKKWILFLILTSVLLTLTTSGLAPNVLIGNWFNVSTLFRLFNIVPILGASILLAMIAAFAEDSSKNIVWASVACAALSAFLISVSGFMVNESRLLDFSIVTNTMVLVLLNLSTFKPR